MNEKVKGILVALIFALVPISAIARTGPFFDFAYNDLLFNFIHGTDNVYLNGIREPTEHIIIPDTVEYKGKKYAVTMICEVGLNNTDGLEGSGIYQLWKPNDITKTITIPETVTTIQCTLHECSKLTTINFPKGLSEYDLKFYNCSGLKEFTLPEVAKAIPEWAFVGCDSLETVYLPDSVDSIGDNAFSKCKALKHIINIDRVKTIGDRAFENCTALEELPLTDNSRLESIGDEAFIGCTALDHFYFPKSINNIGSKAFKGLNLREVSIPGGCDISLYYSFAECPELRSASIGEGPTKLIGTFANCPKLRDVRLPESATTLSYTFYNCPSLTDVTYSSKLAKIGNNTFSGTAIRTLQIPPTVTEIANGGLADCNNLYFIEFLDGPDELSFYETYGGYSHGTINSPALRELYVGRSIKGLSVIGCSDKLATVNFGSQVKSIDSDFLVDMPLITKLSIPNSVETIGENAFKGCSGLTQLYLGSSLREIGDHAFDGARNLMLIESANPVAPDIFSETFLRVNKYDCEVYVPEGSAERYSHTDYWSLFSNFKEKAFTPTSGIADATIGDGGVRLEGGRLVLTGGDTRVRVYTIDGRIVADRQLAEGEAVDLPARGLYIISAAGRSFKIRY